MLSTIKSWILPGKLKHNFISFSLEDQLLPFPWEWSLRPVPLRSEVCCSWPALFRVFSPVPFILVLFQILLLWAHVNLLKNKKITDVDVELHYIRTTIFLGFSKMQKQCLYLKLLLCFNYRAPSSQFFLFLVAVWF